MIPRFRFSSGARVAHHKTSAPHPTRIRLHIDLALRYLDFVDGSLEPLQTDLRMDLDLSEGYERNLQF